MQIQFYNTLTHRLEPFEPIEPGRVSMYNCGPTVYDFAHIGNFRAFVFADVLRRFLELAGYDVQQVMNITDVGHMTEDQLADGAGEDKMQLAMARMKQAKKAGALTAAEVADPNDPYQIAAFYTQAFIDDARQLRLKVADEPDNLPRATDHIEQMLGMIVKLVDEGYAYVAADGAVYFSVEKYPDYGKLSGNTLDKLRGGAGGRVSDEHQSGKRHPADFLLWKPDAKHIMKWPSPFGEGYPGWHIECSAMALHLHHRDQIDVHTGGEDNIFPHHECEIAQSCSFTGKDRFARYWLHTRFLLVEGEKMSKSRGNFHTVRDLVARGVDPVAIRFELLKAHYRSNMNFTMKGLEDSG
ncbi:MAG: cysteine--tRNA ligase, partial [Phycisphaeraceae bacterium]